MKKVLLFTVISLLLIAIGCSRKTAMVMEGTSFTKEQRQMIMAADSNAPMRVYKITNHSDSLLLRKKSLDVRVDPNDPVLNRFVKRLYSTVRDSMSLGLGIAAPQVGVLKNIFWAQRFDKEGAPFEVYLNPKILQYSEKKMTRAEGCLSIPDRRETLDCRAYVIMVEYDKIDGSHHVELVEDFSSIIFQHEQDHLNGILYLDHLKQEISEASSSNSKD